MTVPIPNHADSLESENGPVPRDGHLYNIDDEALEFMKSQTGIQDSKALKDHILTVQAEAYKVRANQ